MRPRTRRIALLAPLAVAAAGALVGRGAGAEEKPDETVKALRFRQLIVEGALDFSHGGGRWHDVLFLPDRKLVAQIVWETEIAHKPEWKSTEHARMYAFEGTLEEQLESRPKDAAEAKPPEEIRIPAALAKEIAELAELTRRQKELSLRLGKAAVEANAVGGKETVKFR